MTFVLTTEGPGRLRVARVVSELRQTVGRNKNVRILMCRYANDHLSRNAESRIFAVYPTQVLAEYSDEYETNEVRLDYQAAMKHLVRQWAHKKADGFEEEISSGQRIPKERRSPK